MSKSTPAHPDSVAFVPKRTHGKPIPLLSESDKARFFSKISTTPNKNGCLLWLAGTFTNGYGAFSLKGRLLKAHRVACYLAHGQIPPGWEACHKCDVPLCCNPDHLFIGTDRDNTQDMLRKGRGNWGKGDRHGSRLHPECRPMGEKHGAAKLTEADVRRIRALKITGIRESEIAQEFGVSAAVIGRIHRREIWRHLA